MTILFWTYRYGVFASDPECDIPGCNAQSKYLWDEGSAVTNLCAPHSFEVYDNARSLAQALLVLEVC